MFFKKISYRILITILFFCLISIHAPAQILIFNPSELMIDGTIGELVIKQIGITNHKNTTVSISIDYKGNTEAFIPTSVFDVYSGETRYINIGFVIDEEEISWLEYTIGSVKQNQLVVIDIKKATPTISVFPNNPKPGGTVAFLILSGDIMDASGILFCSDSGNTYPITISGGMGIVTLNENETGDAIARFSGDDLVPIFVNFTIDDDTNENSQNNNPNNSENNDDDIKLAITAPDNVLYGDIKEISISKGVSPASLVTVSVSKPSGSSYESITNSFGKISISFNEIGTWTFRVISGVQVISKNVVCGRKVGNLYLQTDDPMVDSDVFITVFDDSKIHIDGPDGYTDDDVSDGSTYSFDPSKVGKYTVKAESDTMTGEISFDVFAKSRILVTNIDGSIAGFNALVGDPVYIRLVDSQNNPLDIDTSVQIRKSSQILGIPMEIEIIDSIGQWIPLESGNYIITFEGDGFYSESQMTINTVDKMILPLSFEWYYIIIFIAVILLFILGMYKKNIRFRAWVMKIRSRRKKEEIPEPK